MSRESSVAAGERAYQAIRTGVLSGQYAPGTVLAESELAQALGVSRTPVRQALQVLLQEELLEVGPRRQLAVRHMPVHRREETFRLRLALEEVAVVEACKAMSADDLDQLRLNHFRQRRVAGEGDIEAFLDLDDDFHLSIARGANMPLLERFLGQLRAFVRLMGRDALTHPGRLQEVPNEHENILDALEARDPAEAVRALRHHLETTAHTITVANAD